MDIKDFVIINPLTGEETKVSETEYKQYRKSVNNYWVKHRRRNTCDLEHYSRAVAFCPMNCDICDHNCGNNYSSLDAMFEKVAQDECQYLDESLVDNNTPDVLYEKELLYRKLNEVVSNLSPKQRKVCELIMEGKNHGEIVRILGTDDANVYRIFDRAKAKILAELKDYI